MSKDEKPKIELTEEQELILKGVRPKGMEQWQFKLLRKIINKHIYEYLKGSNER